MAWLERRVPPGPVRFLLVGGMAAGVHYGAALGFHGGLSFSPAWSNFIAFGCAFPVSYGGHRVFSFPHTCLPHRQALPRFAAVALSSFVGNQALLLGLLQWAGWPFWLALGCALVSVALLTYLLSRHWAFR